MTATLKSGHRFRSVVLLNGQYWTFIGEWYLLSLRDIASRDQAWSGRLSSGLFGRHNCPAGNRGPKSSTEVIVASGDAGLEWLIRNRFRPCPVCKPHETPGFREKTHVLVGNKYRSFQTFVDPARLPFSAIPLPWEEMLEMTGAPPNRLYVPEDTPLRSLIRLRNRFANAGHSLPPVGCYDRAAPGRFREYAVPG